MQLNAPHGGQGEAPFQPQQAGSRTIMGRPDQCLLPSEGPGMTSFLHFLDSGVSIRPAVGRRRESTRCCRWRIRMAKMDSHIYMLPYEPAGMGRRTLLHVEGQGANRNDFNSHNPLPSISCTLCSSFRSSVLSRSSPLPSQERPLPWKSL